MKRALSVVLCFVFVLLSVPFSALPAAADTYGDFVYSVSGGEATISGYTGSGGDVVIPSLLGGYAVTSIGNDAFRGCGSLTSITIPGSVTSIGEGAFYYCPKLTHVNIPNSVTSIGNNAFYYCSSLASVTIPNNVIRIGDSAFCECYSLTSISIPDGVTSIGNAVFSLCPRLTSVTIPSSITSISGLAFYGCTGLTSVNIPNSVMSIGKDTFSHCTNLTSITIPDSVTSIGEGAFSYCTSLTSVTIPAGVTSIEISTFNGCTSLKSVYIPVGVMSIGNYAFSGCESLTSVNIPNSVKSISWRAFYNCSIITSINIPNSVTSIGGLVFDGCKNLTEIYCEVAQKPEEWDSNWLGDCDAAVHWGIGSDTTISDGTFNYLSTFTDKNEVYDYHYEDAFFDYSAYEYDHKLARMSLCAAMASMGYYKSEESTGSKNIKELYGKIGIGNSTIEDHYEKPNNNADSIGFVIGSKNIASTDGDYSLIAVTIRSGGYENEWISNFTMGESGDHEGFSAAANVVKNSIVSYINNPKYDLLPNKKVWIQGYSRGGAVTNLTAAYLDIAVFKNEIPGLELKDIYAYGFEVPQGRGDFVGPKPVPEETYNNIFSIVNPSDLVTKVAPSAYGFGRYGVTLETPTALNSKNTGSKRNFEDVYVPAMISEYDDILSRLSEVVPDTFDYGTSYNQQILFDYLIECIAGAIGTRKDYYSIQDTMSHLAGFAMMKQFDSLKPITVSITDFDDPIFSYVIFTTTTEDSDGDGKPDEPDISLKDFLISYSFKTISTVSFTSVDIFMGNYYMSLSRKQFDKLLNGLFDYYYRETGERINMEIICLGVTGQADEEHVMGLFTNLNSITNLQYAHYPELCLAWMNATNELAASGKTRYLYVHCPVDVNVYDGNGKLVASVENDSVKKQGEGPVQAYVDAVGTKIFLLPDSEEYRVEVTATDNGEVDYSVAEYDHSAGMFTRYVDYKGITVNKGSKLKGVIDDLDTTETAEYELRNTDNKPIAAANDVQGAGANALALEDHSSLDRDISEFLDFFVPGDVNGNGKIDSKDYAMTKRAFLKTYELSPEQLLRADINGNGKADSSEYAMIKRHFLKTYVIPGAEGA